MAPACASQVFHDSHPLSGIHYKKILISFLGGLTSLSNLRVQAPLVFDRTADPGSHRRFLQTPVLPRVQCARTMFSRSPCQLLSVDFCSRFQKCDSMHTRARLILDLQPVHQFFKLHGVFLVYFARISIHFAQGCGSYIVPSSSSFHPRLMHYKRIHRTQGTASQSELPNKQPRSFMYTDHRSNFP